MSEHTKPENMTEFEKVDCIYATRKEIDRLKSENAKLHDIAGAYSLQIAYKQEQCDQLAHENIELEQECDQLKAELEQTRVQLAGCGVAAMCNTRKSMTEQLCKPGDYGYSASYQDVLNSVNREIEMREERDRLKGELEEAQQSKLKIGVELDKWRNRAVANRANCQDLEHQLAEVKGELETTQLHLMEEETTRKIWEQDCKKAESQLAEARAEIDKTYGEHCGRDFMHLPLNEAVGAVLSEARAEVERSNAGWDRANTKLIGEAMKHSNELAEARQEVAREIMRIGDKLLKQGYTATVISKYMYEIQTKFKLEG